MGAKAPGVATAPLLRELGIAPIEAMGAAARTRAFLKAPTLNTCISDLVRQPSRMLPNTWTSGTVRWLDRFARASAELAQNLRVPPAWRSLQPRVASNLVKAAVWGRFETSSSACTNTWSIYSQASYVGNPLPQYGTGIPAGAVAGLHIMIQLRTRVFPTARRLARIHAMPERFLHHCPACGGDVIESIEHILLECPRWECHRRNFGALAPDFNGFVRRFATSPEDINALLLGGVPPSLHGATHFTGNGRLWRQALPHIAFFVVHVSHSRNVLLREMGLGPSRISRMGRRPDG